MAITFDPINKRIVLDTSYVKNTTLYSRWKEWVKEGDNAKFLPAFSTVGGDPLGGDRFVAAYIFLTNGWKIRPMETSHTLVIDGNITSTDGLDPVVPTLGQHQVLVQYTVPVQAQAIATSGGGGGASAAEVAAAVRVALGPELAKIEQFRFTEPNKVDAHCDGGGSTNPPAPVLKWNGSAWVPQ